MLNIRGGPLALVLLGSLGCGYCQAGTWKDDPGNWERAFGMPQPADVVVLHSQYERGFHFSYEFSYFFEIAPNDALKEKILSDDALGERNDSDSCVGPAWFDPSPERHESWGYKDGMSDFRMFVDRETGTLLLSDCQL